MSAYYTPTAVTATADGLTTGLIPKEVGAPGYFVSVTSGNANHIITLPATTLFKVTKTAADTFILQAIDEGGDEVTAPVPD